MIASITTIVLASGCDASPWADAAAWEPDRPDEVAEQVEDAVGGLASIELLAEDASDMHVTYEVARTWTAEELEGGAAQDGFTEFGLEPPSFVGDRGSWEDVYIGSATVVFEPPVPVDAPDVEGMCAPSRGEVGQVAEAEITWYADGGGISWPQLVELGDGADAVRCTLPLDPGPPPAD